MKSGIDKRIVKTKHSIRCAFRELIQTKEMVDISISELTAKANITRSTFYMYYDHVSEVRDEIENEMLDRLDRVLNEQGVGNMLSNPYPILDALSKEITKYDEFNKYLVSGKNSGQLIDKLKKHVIDQVMKTVDIKNEEEKLAFRYKVTFLTAGLLDTYKEWYNYNGTMTLPELCEHFSHIILYGHMF